MPSYARLADVPGPVDLVVIFRNAAAVPEHIREIGPRNLDAVWLPPGVSSGEAEAEAERIAITLVEDGCIEEEYRYANQGGGHPRKLGVHLSRRRKQYEDNRKHPKESGYVADGGGGHAGGGGVRATLDEKKMVAGRPSRRRGLFKVLAAVRLHGRHRGRRGTA